MTTVAQTPSFKTALDEDQAIALLEYLRNSTGSLLLDAGGYRRMAVHGWTRSELQSAIATLKAAGTVTVSPFCGTLLVELTEEEAQECSRA